MSPDTLHDQLQASLGASYTIHRELEGGAMARVFVAREERLGRDVVVKVPGPEQAWGVSAERFAREIRLAAALQEPHIVPLLSAGETVVGLPYYTMPYVRGESLRRRLAEGPLPREGALMVLADVARALAYAHDHGVVHRDIKPANVLLSSGSAVVTDFGIAKALSASRLRSGDGTDDAVPSVDPFATGAPRGLAEQLRTTERTTTGTGASLGTPAYMAPEQSVGDEVGPSADVYAWGVMAYELLAGAHPFADCVTAPQLLAAHLAKTPAPLMQKAPGLPRALAALVMRCLEKTPAQRPQTGAELLAELSRATATRSPSRRERTVTLATVASAVVALVLGGESFLRARSAEAAAPPLVAVLPFESVGPTPDTLFAGALEDAVTGKLSRLSGLRVIDRQSVVTIRKRVASARDVGRELGADFVLRATVRWGRDEGGAADALVTPVLVRVKDGTTTWSGGPVTVRASDPFTVQATLAADVAEALDVALARPERTALASTPTVDTAAFAAYTRGLTLLNTITGFPSAPVFRQALAEFQRAYRIDPRYADAWARAAYTVAYLRWSGSYHDIPLDSALRLARRALALDPSHPIANWVVSNDRDERGDVAGARAVLERAARANPSSVELMRYLAQAQLGTGDTTAARATARRLLRLAPRSWGALSAAATVAVALRNDTLAARLYYEMLGVEPERLQAWLRLAALAAGRGDSDGVASAVREYRAHGGRDNSSLLMFLLFGGPALREELERATPASFNLTTQLDSGGYFFKKAEAYLWRGDTVRARPYLDTLLARAGRDSADADKVTLDERRADLVELANLHAMRGNRTTAYAALGEAQDPRRFPTPAAGRIADDLACQKAFTYASLDDVEHMLPELRQCVTSPNGSRETFVRQYPVFRRQLGDPRVQAVLYPSSTRR